MKAFIQLTNNRSCLLRADEIKADYERGHITVSDGGRIQGVFDMGVLEYVYMAEPRKGARMTEKDLIIQDLRRENAELRARVPKWISVKEHIPQENEPENTLCENVQVLLNNGKVSVGWCNRRKKLWWHMEYDEDYFISNDYDHTPVIAWQPLAQPPKGE